MEDDATGAVRGCLFALAIEACVFVVGWVAWHLLRYAFG